MIQNEHVRFPCQCCGYKTLSALKEQEICPICWWQDEGQDDEDADVVYGGANARLSLTQARANFLKHGICNPARTDLMGWRDDPSLYEKGRVFYLDGDKVKERK